jgi:tagatose 1,6-diphosphate aldolase
MNGKRSLTIGKRRGLISSSSSEGSFTILAFDHRQSFEKMLGATSPRPNPYREIVAAKLEVISELASHASAILLDPLYSAPQAIAGDVLPAQTGLLVAIEETGYSGTSTSRTTSILHDWGVEKIKRMGADAVKLLIYYHPDASLVTERQERLVSEVIEACKVHDIALFLEIISYSIKHKLKKDSAAFAQLKPGLITRSAAKLNALGPDVLKLEFPVDAHYNNDEALWRSACQAITDTVDCPWTVLSAGVDFPVFAKQVQIACEAGASGYIAGRAVWQEGMLMKPSKRRQWMSEVGAKRLIELQQIAQEYALPWQTYFPPDDGQNYQQWYAKY